MAYGDASTYEGLLHYRIWTHSAKRGVIYWGDAYVLTIQKGELFIGDIAHVEIEDHNKQALIQVLDQAFATYDYLIYKKQALNMKDYTELKIYVYRN